MNSNVTGEAYFKAITARESDRLIREAFQSLAIRIVNPGASILDFGCGPGIDAQFYAEHGYNVTAYDVDPEMRAFFKVYCGAQIESGLVKLVADDCDDFVGAHNPVQDESIDLITANFAPLNLVNNLRDVFTKFCALTRMNGRVLVSVLNPYFIQDMKYRWRVSNQWRLWRDGHFALKQLPGTVIRRHPSSFAAEAAPHFVLERVFPDFSHAQIDSYVPGDGAYRMRAIDWLRLMNCMFLFLLFRRESLSSGQAVNTQCNSRQ